MAVIGVICCEVLELEFARLLGTDPDVGCVSVLEDRHSARLIEALALQEVTLRRLPHPHAFHREPHLALEALVRVLEMGLHRSRRALREALIRAAHELRPRVDALLLGYGLCGNALDDPRAVLDLDVPLFLPMDRDHPVDDCIALCLGGREPYYAEQRLVAGTYFLTPGWSWHWRKMVDARSGALAQPALKRLLANYERALLVQTPVLAQEELLRRGEEFCRQTGLRLETRQGNTDLLTAAWRSAKQSLAQAGGGCEAP